MTRKIYKQVWFLPVCIVLVAAAFTGTVVWYKQNKNKSSSHASKLFVYECSPAKPESIECQQKQYVDIVDSSGIEQAFSAVKADYATSPSVKANCHQITHAIGREAAAKYGTIESAYDKGDNFCWSGYYHGVMEAISKDLGKDKINADLTSVCANVAATRQYSFYHFNCVHGLGHGLMGVNGDELPQVLKLCDKFGDDWEKQSCYGGAFMENIMIAFQMGGQSKYLRDSEPLYPCTIVDQPYKQQCYLMQTSQALRVLNNDYAQVFALCATTGEFQATCNQSLGRDASGNSNSNKDSTVAVCMLGADEEAQKNCFIGAVKDFISYFHGDTQATELCNALTPNLAQICTQTKEEYMRTL